MSFLIDDILKKDSSSDKVAFQKSVHQRNNSESSSCPSESENVNERSSILQQRLETPYRTFNDYYSKANYANNYNLARECDNYWPSFSYCEVYPERVMTYANMMYARSRSWPSPYSTSLAFATHYSQYYTKRKGGQVRFTTNQTDALEKRFVSHKYLSPEDRKILADSLKLTDRQVKTWFQNRRAKWRRCNSSSSDSDVPLSPKPQLKPPH